MHELGVIVHKEKLTHDQEMFALAGDSYDSVWGAEVPPPGDPKYGRSCKR
jgi:hypothetical protein